MNQEPTPALENNALRLSAALLIAFAFAFFLYYGLNTISDPVFSIDFSPYYIAGQLLADGHNAQLIPQPADGFFTSSAKPFLDNFQRYFFADSPVATGWIYPAGYAWLFRPFAKMDFPTASRWWLTINMLLSCASIFLVIQARPWRGDPRYRAWRMAWIVFLGLSFQPILDNLWHGNISAVILLCFCLSYLLLRRDRHLLAGLVLGLIVPLKLTPALFVLYFIWRKDWKFTIGAAAGSLLIVLATFLTAGVDGLLSYAGMILAQLNAGGVAAFNNQSIAGLLLHLFTWGNINGWENVSVPVWVTLLRYLLLLGLLTAGGWAMRKPPEKLGKSVIAEDLDFCLLIGVMLLASPITWYHYYVWLLLPLVVVFDLLLSGPASPRLVTLFALAYGLLVMQGFSQIRTFDQQSIQDIWLLRLLVSSSTIGLLVFFGLSVRLRKKLG
jgi:hypothetical protein